jgi:peptidoglycan/xylan/chitin deacetylase (PgdA/CDA1 family)
MSTPVVLLYHAVKPMPADADREERGLFVDPEAFTQQMSDLADRGLRSLTLDEYADGLARGHTPSDRFLLTFDDAYAHVGETVTPILRRFGFSAVMFAPWHHLGGTNTWDEAHRNLTLLEIASPDQLAAMDRATWEIGSHGFRHVDLVGLDTAQRRNELRAARERLTEVVGRAVVDLAYPFGMADAGVREDARLAGYRMAFLAGPTNSPDWFRLPRHPIRGDESIEVFRLKTSAWARHLYRVNHLAPAWIKAGVRAVLR